jgi:hypothetical protein
MSRSAWLLVVLATQAAAQEWQVSASVRHSADGPLDPAMQRPVLVQAFDVTCTPPPNRTANWSSPGIRTVFASEPEESFTVGGGVGAVVASQQFSGRVVTATAVLGAKVRPELVVTCGGGLGGGSEPVRVVGEAIATAPLIPAASVLATREGSFTEAYSERMPADVTVRLRAVLYAQPRGSERVIVHAEGPGISVQRSYGDEPGSEARAAAVNRAFLADPAFVVTPTGPGTIRLWAEFEGLKSEERTLVVEAPLPPVVEMPDEQPTSGAGCSAIPVPAVLLALGLLRARRIRR